MKSDFGFYGLTFVYKFLYIKNSGKYFKKKNS